MGLPPIITDDGILCTSEYSVGGDFNDGGDWAVKGVAEGVMRCVMVRKPRFGSPLMGACEVGDVRTLTRSKHGIVLYMWGYVVHPYKNGGLHEFVFRHQVDATKMDQRSTPEQSEPKQLALF